MSERTCEGCGGTGGPDDHQCECCKGRGYQVTMSDPNPAYVHEQAVLARACVTRAVRELQEALARCAVISDESDDFNAPTLHVRKAEVEAADALEVLNRELAKEKP